MTLSRSAANAALKASAVALDQAKVGTRSRSGSTTGEGWCRERHQKTATPSAADPKQVMTAGLPHPQAGALTSARDKVPIDIRRTPPPRKSGHSAVVLCRVSGIDQAGTGVRPGGPRLRAIDLSSRPKPAPGSGPARLAQPSASTDREPALTLPRGRLRYSAGIRAPQMRGAP
jgi:hypothetical protein